MQKLLAILLLALFGLPVVSPLFALGTGVDAGLPACCRKSGKHHCMMSMGERSQLGQDDPALSSLPEKCPYCPGTTAATRPDVLTGASAEAILASLVSDPAGVAQTESKRRIARDRSRQKRGPPANLLS